MCDVMTHRGPDDEGFYFSTSVGLGIRRLSIIDLETGHQPVLNEDGTIAVVLNGEIYNYRELRRMLASRGHQFATASDTEAIVHLYEEYGEECTNRLRGMFCFALWDEKRQRLLLARDRVGIKQVYYAERDGQLLFGSEIKCILQDRDFLRRINLQALAAYLTFLYVPYPATIFEGISELPPAHYLVWERGRIRLQRYWHLKYHTEPGRPESYYVEGLRDRLASAVSSHLIADVPLGAFLSGGIDSGSVVALMSQVASGPVKTFTIGFEGNYGLYDEREDARRVAERYQTHHKEFLVRPDVTSVLPQIVWALDQPLADSSVIPSYYVCQMARTCVTVALSAMGGDEMAGGYERYLGVMLGDHYRNLPEAPRRAVSRIARSLPDLGGKGRFSTARLKRFLRSADRDLAGAYFQLLATFDGAELGRIIAGDQKAEVSAFVPEELVREAFRRSESHGVVNQMLFADLNAYLPCDLLPLTDRMSMVHSLEVRVPFLDHELLEFAATIPPELKIRRLTKKYILRKAAADLLPREQFRKSKRGFSIPLAFWLRNELRPFVEHQLSPTRVREAGYFDPRYVSILLEEHLSARENHENKIWALLVFSIWHELYMNGARSDCVAGSAREAESTNHGR
jgi:asparagine synthase (glutamine-hydrolysing)